MLNRLINFSIQNKFIIGLLTLALVIWGAWSATQLPIDAVPDITNNQVQIITACPTLATQEVEQLVTYPIERSLANVPDLVELRSISRFGLSVVTVVFEDDVNIWFGRQLVNEKLQEAEEEIPTGVGTPEMAPVSTGLGEIYQYILHPKPGSEQKYTAADLRTLQDWVVARQILGTPGVAEVNSFGGLLKQYEVAVNPDRLRAMEVTIPEIFTALERNNENTGGAYIDRKPNAYFIRGVGLVRTLEDVGNIVIKNSPNGQPITVRDVASVRFGAAVRYGALTYNGEAEAVGGIVMMLKGANSFDVVTRVKAKMATIQQSLPDDVIIEPFLDRTDLVNRAMGTVEKNLVEGALIVIFVLVLFLGNLRAGLIVASAIPLSMLFALGMMHVFDVSANLMSLGAIDFGLIVDGAVIIVEATMHYLAQQRRDRAFTQPEMDAAVQTSAGKMMNSAAFGQIIILIVYLPILSLVGIEGKMFRPMAQTVGFAILGALLLSLTYIPMMSALFLPKSLNHDRKTWADRMMDFFQRGYAPVIRSAIRFKYAVVAAAVALLAVALVLFNRLGGEFLPQLAEGDYAFHCILPQGASLSQSIETSMQAARIIRQFPEVKMVIGKTGAAEVPTDPMPPEASDMMVILKPEKEWTSGRTFSGLSAEIQERLETIPGVFFEANQPIQMRFNELMTGVRQDVAIKIFGENIDTLAKLAPKVAALVQSVDGTTEPQVERTTGLPQITIEYDRRRLASYGLTIEDINHIISTAFAGSSAGVVFENERKFDLVVRLDTAARNSIEDVRNLYVPTNSGAQVPLSQVASVSFKEGPAQISREEGKRRIVVGFNVRGRDVQSVVRDIQSRLPDAVKMPTGYYVTYGGTFENLEQASARLQVAVPVALTLIFLLLFFAFSSLKEAVLIFTAIPMAAIGGVFALLLRGMPFSISAGVGFIALFGVAVLNGIVLIATFNDLVRQGVADPVQRVLEGTRMRLRPVLMTAIVASFGFLPMAISTGAGAEVQKPLATVVIGGLITATALTLVVLPLLYLIFGGKAINLPRRRKGGTDAAAALLVLILIGTSTSSYAQEPRRIGIEDALNLAAQGNLQLQANQFQVQRAQALTRTAFELPKTGLFVENEDLGAADPNGILKIGLSQAVEWPTVYKARRRLFDEQLKAAELGAPVIAAELRRNVRAAYYQLWYLEDRQRLFLRLDTIYSQLADAAAVRARTGESTGLERIAAEARLRELRSQREQITREVNSTQQSLVQLLGQPDLLLPQDRPLEKLAVPVAVSTTDNPVLARQRQQVQIANAEVFLQRQSLKPDFSGRFFSQYLYGVEPAVSGFSVSMGVPLIGRSTYRQRIKAAELESIFQQRTLDYEMLALEIRRRQAQQEAEKFATALQFYESTGLQQADEILRAAEQSYRVGEISFADLAQYLSQAIGIRQNYLERMNEYNQAVIHILYLSNQ